MKTEKVYISGTRPNTKEEGSLEEEMCIRTRRMEEIDTTSEERRNRRTSQADRTN